MDRTILDLSRAKIEYAALGNILHDDPDALLFVSFTGDDRGELGGQLDRLTALWAGHGHGYHTLRAETPAQQGALLKVRKSGLGLLMAASTGSNRPLAFVEDTAVPPERLAEYTARFAKVLERHGCAPGSTGTARWLPAHPAVRGPVPAGGGGPDARGGRGDPRPGHEFGGANSSEHGDGLARSEFNRQLFGDRLYEAMRQVKHIFDPDNRMNPGKIVDSPAMTDNLRDASLPRRPRCAPRWTSPCWPAAPPGCAGRLTGA